MVYLLIFCTVDRARGDHKKAHHPWLNKFLLQVDLGIVVTKQLTCCRRENGRASFVSPPLNGLEIQYPLVGQPRSPP